MACKTCIIQLALQIIDVFVILISMIDGFGFANSMRNKVVVECETRLQLILVVVTADLLTYYHLLCPQNLPRKIMLLW